MQYFTAVLSALALAASTASANPIAARYNGTGWPRPQIISPPAGQFWNSGSLQSVTWNTSGISETYPGLIGNLFLGNDEDDLHFSTISLSSQGTYLATGISTFQVPNVTTSTHYYLILSVNDQATVNPVDISQPENKSPYIVITGP